MFYDAFWDSESVNTVESIMLKPAHIWALVIGVVFLVFFLVWLRKYADNDTRKKFRYILATVLLVQDIILTIWYATSGAWNWELTLPLELSRISIYLTIIMLFSGSYTMFEVLFLLSIGGFTQALATPNLTYTFPHVRYILYFLSHFGMMLGAFYMWIVEGYKPKVKSIGVAFIVINIFVVIVASINYLLPILGLTDQPGNYMFLARRPNFKTIIDLLIAIFGKHPWYIIGLQFLGLFSFSITYLPFSIYYMIKKRPKPKSDTIFLNIFPGLGLGSFLQKNYFAGFIQFILQAGGLLLFILLYNFLPGQGLTNLIILLVMLAVGYIYGIIAPLRYNPDKKEKEDYNVDLNKAKTPVE
jgi:hypothetical integral membrane protein (TIGR02206 family)